MWLYSMDKHEFGPRLIHFFVIDAKNDQKMLIFGHFWSEIGHFWPEIDLFLKLESSMSPKWHGNGPKKSKTQRQNILDGVYCGYRCHRNTYNYWALPNRPIHPPTCWFMYLMPRNRPKIAVCHVETTELSHFWPTFGTQKCDDQIFSGVHVKATKLSHFRPDFPPKIRWHFPACSCKTPRVIALLT